MAKEKKENLIVNPIVNPGSMALETLKQAKFTEPKKLRKPGGEEKEVERRLVLEGAGLVGLEKREENQEWAGIFNHYVKVAGASLQLGRLLKLNGHPIDLQLTLNAALLSHSGRRQYDEAMWYPDHVDNADKKKAEGDTKIGFENLKSKNMPPELLEIIAAHGLGTITSFEKAAISTWENRLPLYLDFRISQEPMSMKARFADL